MSKYHRLCVVLSGAVLWTLVAPALAQDATPGKSGYTLFNPTPDADLRAFSTDRPPKANSPYTVDAGHFQYETDLVVFGKGEAGSVKTQDWTVLDPTLKVGVNNTIDAELQITPYESVRTTGASAAPGGANAGSLSGIGDTYARLKWNVLGDDRGDVAVALLPYIKLPTAHAGLGNDRVECGLIVPISVSAPGGFTVIVMPEGDYLKDSSDSGYHGAFDILVNVSHALDARWTVYTEAFTSRTFSAHNQPVYTLDEALTFAITPNLQLDFGGNFSLNAVAPRVQLYTGLSQRF